jgi:hypothetical protein
MAENSTPTSAPTNAAGTADVAELVMTDNFMNTIMGDLAPGEKASLPTTPLAEVAPAAVEPEPAKSEVEETQEVKEEVNSTEETKVETSTSQNELIEKRFKDSQAMIGRQANEIGQLRKQVSALEVDRKKTGEDAVPYYDKLINNNPDALSQELHISREQVDVLQLAARMAKDIVKDTVRPFEKATQEMEIQKEIQKKDAAWYADHPEYKNRQPVMAKFLNKLYPNGPFAHGADPWQAAHMAYEHAGEVMSSVQQNVTQQNDKRIVNARSSDGATRSGDANAALKPQQKALDAKTAEINKAFETQAQQLVRVRG